jgi:hypothetical protein
LAPPSLWQKSLNVIPPRAGIHAAFSISRIDFLHVEVQIMHTKPQALHKSQSASIEKLRHQLASACHMHDDFPCFVFAQDHRHVPLSSGPQSIDFFSCQGYVWNISPDPTASQVFAHPQRCRFSLSDFALASAPVVE